jgi:YD repeat-containing protein
MRVLLKRNVNLRFVAPALAVALSLTLPASTSAANGSVVYSYDALGRVATASYDTGVIIIYSYDANGNRLSQTVNVNTQNLCLGSSAHGNPTTWGRGLLSTYASGC